MPPLGGLPAALLMLGLLGACRETAPLATPQPVRQQMARLESSQQDSVVVLTLYLTGFGATPVASVDAAVDFDATRLRFVGEEPLADGGMRATRDAGGRLVMAAAHAQGFGEGAVMRLRFVATDRDATSGLALSVRDLRLLDGSSALPELLVAPSATMLQRPGGR